MDYTEDRFFEKEVGILNSKIIPFTLTLAIWFIFAGRVNLQILMVGTIVCLMISFMLTNRLFRLGHRTYKWKTIGIKIYGLFLLILIYLFDVFQSAVRVSAHAFEIKPSFSPRIVIMEGSFDKSNRISVLASFITCNQGSLAMDFDHLNNNYLIHWMDVQSDQEVEEKKTRIREHEKLIAKLFD
ncbi:Na+/H+ antiporter subunit E [Halobacillus sp. HZG1]|uniref:Na+/H+ antiporter subunit E n=1 Tax=Halobacillus sp. HZG1 TaxID=3111769 RepID=UPI002DBC9BA9|nr:Na+/H+ antiporter subunit E [Halobacillus sp. HZG1]MEC3884949.1 Na+/H+ antiporter subunit E [Halobacillus sp. HZG1]